jgi:hypothetical protein
VNQDRKLISFLIACTLGSAIVISQASCPNGPGPVGPIINSVIDCLGSNRADVDKLLGEFRPIISGGSVDWGTVKQRAVQAGREIGGCFIMELTQLYLSGTRSTADAKTAHDTAEAFRKDVAGGATFKTICVRQDGTKSECKL